MTELEIRQLIDAALDASYEWEDAKDEESESERNAKRAAYRTAYDNLLASVASLSKDRDRLNQVEELVRQKRLGFDGEFFYTFPIAAGFPQYPSLRDAIDQAMQVSEQETKE